MHPQIVKDKLAILPENSGCYLMKNSKNQIIYVGKAKNIKKRVSSYFIGAHAGKVQKMIEDIEDFELIITKNEAEALILESQLIKAHQPRYNILLKDDKSYPYIAITDEVHPRLILTRKPKSKYRHLFGPYVSACEARTILEMLNYLYPLRKCVKLPKHFCLYYHIKQCIGPCEITFSPGVYDSYITEIIHFLRGNPQKIKEILMQKMKSSSASLEFEQAQTYKDMLSTVDSIYSKKGTHQSILEDTDIIGYANNDSYLAIQIFHVRDGSVVARESDVFVYENTDVIECVESYLHQFYQKKDVIPPKVVYTFERLLEGPLPLSFPTMKWFAPKRGAKKELVTFAKDNAVKALEQKALLAQNQYDNTVGAVEKIGEILGIASPYTIEIIDTANLQHANIVSGLVVFTNGQPNRKQYRKYKITTTLTQDDYQALREVIYRRFYRKIMEDQSLPDLLIVDGGLGHVRVAKEVLEGLNINIPLIGLSKNSSHKTDAIVDDTGKKYILKTNSSAFRLLAKMQEEVHRFVIDYHRKKRIESAFASELTLIPGIGDARRNALLTHFVHINNIKKATITELEAVVPRKLATSIFEFFKGKE